MARDKIVARNVSMRFGDVLAIKDATCSIGEREFVAIIGPSGCGKSTFLYVIAGFEGDFRRRRRTGRRTDTRPGSGSRHRLSGVRPVPWRTVMENVTLGLDIKKTPPQEARRRAQKWITLAGLDGFEDAYPSTLSGGMKQRVAIARALTYDPEVILLDEPFGALDVQTKNYMIHDLQSLWTEANKTIVMVTHSVSEAVLLADRVLIFSARPSSIIADIKIDLPHPRAPATRA